MVVTFSIATNRDWITRDGKKQSLTEYHDVVAWAKLAEIASKYLKKGKLVYIEGYLKTRSWETPEGVKKFKTEIVVQDLIMLDKRKTEENEEFIPDENSIPNNGMQDTVAPSESNVSTKELEERAPKPTVVDIDKDLGL